MKEEGWMEEADGWRRRRNSRPGPDEFLAASTAFVSLPSLSPPHPLPLCPSLSLPPSLRNLFIPRLLADLFTQSDG